MRLSICRMCAISRLPASVINTPWGTRLNSLAPNCASRSVTRLDAAATARLSLSAAREMLPSSAMQRTSWTVVESSFMGVVIAPLVMSDM